MTKKTTISAIIIAKNEEGMIANCLETLEWCDEVIVIDNNSTDKTAQIAENFNARVIGFASKDFSSLRNEGLKKAKTDWVFYIDADERVTPKLSQEILVHIETDSATCFKIRRENMMYGKYFGHGNWEHDWVQRVFNRDSFEKWTGKIHESPKFKGHEIELHQPLLHLTHRNTTQGLKKTIAWTKSEAELLYKANATKVTLFVLFKKTLMEVFRRAILKQGKKDGIEGWIEALVQGMNRFLVYLQLWELQQTPSLEKKYEAEERRINQLWRNNK